MATIKCSKLTVNGEGKSKPLSAGIKYIVNPEKTMDGELVSGVRCSDDYYLEEMMMVKKAFRKTGGREYKHFIQSWHKDEEITPELAHEIGIKTVKGFSHWANFQVVVATHTNSDHIHNHFIVNSVNMNDGYKLSSSKQDLQDLKRCSDDIMREYNLSVCEKGKTFEGNTRTEPTAYDKNTYRALKNKGLSSYIRNIHEAVIEGMTTATSREEFEKMLLDKGISMKGWVTEKGGKALKYLTFTDIARKNDGKKQCSVRSNKLENYFGVPVEASDLDSVFKTNLETLNANIEFEKVDWESVVKNMGITGDETYDYDIKNAYPTMESLMPDIDWEPPSTLEMPLKGNIEEFKVSDINPTEKSRLEVKIERQNIKEVEKTAKNIEISAVETVSEDTTENIEIPTVETDLKKPIKRVSLNRESMKETQKKAEKHNKEVSDRQNQDRKHRRESEKER